MIHSKTLFEDRLQNLMEFIDTESTLPTKSKVTVVCLKCIFDGLMIHGYLLDSGNQHDLQRQQVCIFEITILVEEAADENVERL